MNRYIVFLIFISFLIAKVEAQSFDWIESTKSEVIIFADCFALDDNGGVYITGGFHGSGKLGRETLENSGDEDIFVAKYNRLKELEWVFTAGGPDQDNAFSIAIDPNEGVYITGFFDEYCTFGDVNLGPQLNQQIFLVKLNLMGEFQWVRQAGSYNQNWGKSVIVDDEGMVYIAGSIGANATFEDTTVKASFSSFLAKYTPDGDLLYAQSGTGYTTANAIASDGDNLYITGYFEDELHLGQLEVKKEGRVPAFFIGSMNKDGSANWVYFLDSSSYGIGQSISIDQKGDISAVFWFKDSTSIQGQKYFANGYSDLILLKLNDQGEVLWHTQLGGSIYWNDKSIISDAQNSIYLTGSFVNKEVFDSMELSAIGQDAFIAKYSSSGKLEWVMEGKGQYQNYGTSLAYNSFSDKIYCLGNFGDTITFGETVLPGVGNDFYFGALHANTHSNTSDIDLTFFPNPTTGKIFIKPYNALKISVFDVQGRLVKEVTNASDIDLTGYHNGVYVIQVTYKNTVLIKKTLKITQ